MDLAYELTDLVRSLRRWAEHALRAESMNYNSYAALEFIARRPGNTGAQLALRLGVSEPAASNILRGFREAGYVRNTATAGAGNVRHWVLTPIGEQKRATCAKLLVHSLDSNAKAIGADPHELAATIHALHLEAKASREYRAIE